MKLQIKTLKEQSQRIFTGSFLIMILSVSFVIAQTPQTAKDYVNRGNDYYDQEKFDLAIADYTKAIEIDPQYADAYYGRGLAYYDQNKIDLAIADFTKSIEINPQDADAFSARGLAYYDQEKIDLAIIDFTKAIEIDSQDADSYFGRGLAYIQKNYDETIDDKSVEFERNYELAIADYTQAIQLDPNDCNAYLSRAETYDLQGKWKLALADEKKANALRRKSKEGCKKQETEKDVTKQERTVTKPYPMSISSGGFGKRTNLDKRETSNRLRSIKKSRKVVYRRNRKKRLRSRKPPVVAKTSTTSREANLPKTPVQPTLPENDKTLSGAGDGKAVTGVNEPTPNRPENPNNPLISQSGNSANLKNSIGMEFVNVPTGSFTMGSEDGGSDEKPVHKVAISQNFQMSKYEVTQGQWKTVMGYNPSSFKDCPQCPVENVSWDEVQEFIGKLNVANDGYKYRLPTEAEWEYAARAGTAENNGSNVTSAAWYIGNSGNKTHPVGQKLPNGWGLYDMHGNVSEWCQDWYGSYPSGNITDPTGPSRGPNRVFRGSAWHDSAAFLRLANRGSLTSGSRHYDLGFRVVRTNK